MKASDIRRGQVIVFEGAPCRVMEYQHRTPGNLRAFVQVRMRSLTAGNTFEHRFSATENVERAHLDTKQFQVLYQDASGVHVMDTTSYEQYTLDPEVVGDAAPWLQADTVFAAEWLDGRPVGIELPAAVEREIVDTAPVLKGATKQAGTKPAKLDNGVTVNVPEYLSVGERVKVDPRSGGTYLERVK